MAGTRTLEASETNSAAVARRKGIGAGEGEEPGESSDHGADAQSTLAPEDLTSFAYLAASAFT